MQAVRSSLSQGENRHPGMKHSRQAWRFADLATLAISSFDFPRKATDFLVRASCVHRCVYPVCISDGDRHLTSSSIATAKCMWIDDREKAIEAYGHISDWDTSGVTNMAGYVPASTH